MRNGYSRAQCVSLTSGALPGRLPGQSRVGLHRWRPLGAPGSSESTSLCSAWSSHPQASSHGHISPICPQRTSSLSRCTSMPGPCSLLESSSPSQGAVPVQQTQQVTSWLPLCLPVPACPLPPSQSTQAQDLCLIPPPPHNSAHHIIDAQ